MQARNGAHQVRPGLRRIDRKGSGQVVEVGLSKTGLVCERATRDSAAALRGMREMKREWVSMGWNGG